MCASARQVEHNVLNLSVCSSVPYQTCEHSISKMKETILAQIDASDPLSKNMKCSTLGGQEIKDQGHTRLKVDVEASFPASLGPVAFLMFPV